MTITIGKALIVTIIVVTLFVNARKTSNAQIAKADATSEAQKVDIWTDPSRPDDQQVNGGLLCVLDVSNRSEYLVEFTMAAALNSNTHDDKRDSSCSLDQVEEVKYEGLIVADGPEKHCAMPVDTLLAMSATAATPKSPNDAQSQTLPSICDSPVALSPASSPTTLINNALSGDPATASAAYKGPSVYCSASFISSAVLSLAQKLVLPIVNVVHDVSRHYSQELYLRMTGTRNRVRYYRHLVDIANSYEQWAAAGYMLIDTKVLHIL
ncbi:hypothetical protein BASA62_001304 [Batrachochytrium salamandrivorans]|nr:hypothetical protein BASA62_001304 [Batrachochytrium salamandrivorans]